MQKGANGAERAVMSAPIRVGIDARKLDDYGIGTYLGQLIAHLARPGSPLDLVAYHPHPDPPPLKTAGHVAWVKQSAPAYSIREQFALHRQARRHGLHLLHIPHYVVPWIAPCPMVVTIHDVIHLLFAENLPGAAARIYARLMLNRAAATARRIITVSQSSKRDLMQHLDVPEGKITVIPLGLPPDCRPGAIEGQPASVTAGCGIDGPFLLAAGNFRQRHKNLPLLLEAYRLLRQTLPSAPVLVIAGDLPSQGRHCEPLSRDGVICLGRISRVQLISLYRAAEAFVSPSSYEGFGLTVLEAMGCGLPVVAADCAAVREVADGAALLAAPGDARDMAGAMGRVLSDEGLREDLSRRAIARSRRYSWDEHARRTLAVYQEALGLNP